MSRDKRYQKLLNARQWWETKAIVWQRAKGLCEECYEQGIRERGIPYITPGVDCHHIVPVETAKTLYDMERLCYDPNNCRLLCVEHHRQVHTELGSQTKEGHLKAEADRLDRWLDRHTRKPETDIDTNNK